MTGSLIQRIGFYSCFLEFRNLIYKRYFEYWTSIHIIYWIQPGSTESVAIESQRPDAYILAFIELYCELKSIAMKKIGILVLLIIAFTTASAQIVINEGSNKNYSSIIDEEGEYTDWIELYNPSAVAVDLYNYTLTDTMTQPAQWAFPHFTLQPGAYEVVFCSGKNYYATPPFAPVINTILLSILFFKRKLHFIIYIYLSFCNLLQFRL